MDQSHSKFYITTFQDYSQDIYVEGINYDAKYKKAKLFSFIKPDRSLFIFKNNNVFRVLLRLVVESKAFETVILLAILANCIIMALWIQLPQNDSNILNDKLEQSEVYFMVIFLLESVMKIITYGFILHKNSYLRSGWNVLDFLIVLVGTISFILSRVQNGSSVDVKALRAFRVLRPLRLVSNLPSLQVVLNSIILAMQPLANIAALILFLMIVYSIIGMDLFMGKLHATCYNNVTLQIMDSPVTCSVDELSSGFHCLGLSALPAGQQWACMDFKNNTLPNLRWPGPNDGITNFDNMALAMLTVFQVITKEGWIDDLYAVNDSVGNEWPWIYFVSIMLLITFFVLSLILGVLSGEFSKQSAKISDQNVFLRERRSKKDNQDYIGYKNWIEYAEKLEEILKPSTLSTINEDVYKTYLKDKRVDDNKALSFKEKCCGPNGSFNNLRVRLQKSLISLIKSRIFFIIIIVVVFLNTVIMATEFTNQPAWLTAFQNYANIVFVIFFSLELILKLIAIGPHRYYSKLFNIFDFIVIVCSIMELCLTSYNVFDRIGLAVLRCARLLRAFKLTQYWESLRSLVKNMIGSMKSIFSLLVLLGLFIIIFSLLGMQLFGGKFNPIDRPRSNFDSFPVAMMTVFQIITGDDWNTVMYSGINAYNGIQSYGGAFAIYFVFLYILGNYILLNVFLAIAVESLRCGDDDEEEDEVENEKASTSNDTSYKDPEAKRPEITNRVVVINGCTMLPPIMKNDILSVNKIKKKSKKRLNTEQRVRINFEEKEIIEETDEAAPQLGNMTYNELYAEEEVPDENNDPGVDNPTPSLIPKASDFKNLKEIKVPIPVGAACFIFRDSNIFRVKCYNLANNVLFKNMLLVCIIMSSIMLAAEDPLNDKSGRNTALNYFDFLFTGVFTFEIVLKLIAYGVILHKNAFLRNAFNWIDLLVVILGITDNILRSQNQDVGMSALKTLRVFRVLRPLRAINRAKGLKHVLRCVIVALKTIAKIMIITFLLEFMFAVMGVIIMKGTFYSCTDASKFTSDTCKGYFISFPTNGVSPPFLLTRSWTNSQLNYDNVANGMLTLFVVATFSGWSTLLFKSIDATNENQGPLLNNKPAMFIYYFLFIVIIAFFMINIFVGMVIVTFQKEGDAEYVKYKLDKNKRQCIDFALKARPITRYIPSEPRRYKVWRFVSSKNFEIFIVILIIMNTACLGASYLEQSQSYSDVFKYLNIIFIIIFTAECILKMYAFNFRTYFTDPMNVFDAIVITGSYVDIPFSQIDLGDDVVRLNLFRLFRVLRLIRLLSKVKSIRQLLWTFIKSFRSLPYVMLLIILTFFIYSIMGMNFFGKIALNNTGSVINRNNNFQTFYNSLLVLFRCVTGENWQAVMLSCIYDPIATCINSNDICGTTISYIYFTSFAMLCSFLIINLFIAVIIDNFDYLTRDNSILGSHHLESFVGAWSEYDIDGSGRIKHLDIVNMLSCINPPLGFGKMCPQVRALQNLIKLNMPLQTDGTVLFNATLFALVRKSLKIKYSETANAKQLTKQYNDELRTIIKTYWKSTSPLLLDQVITPNINESVTIGKFYATFIIENWFKRCKMKKFAESNNPVSTENKSVIEFKRKFPVKMQNGSEDPKDDDISETTTEATLTSIKGAYGKISESVWSALSDIFTIREDDEKL